MVAELNNMRSINNLLGNFFPSRRKTKSGNYISNSPITLTPVYRARSMTDEQRRAYATELLDSYYGFSKPYLIKFIQKSISDNNIKQEMQKIARSLPLLQFFTNSISRVYGSQPSRKFFLDGKEIIKTPISEDIKLNKDKFVYDDELFDTLMSLYNDSVTTAIKQSEKYTNLLHTTVHKIITDEIGNIRMIFIPNDTIQIKSVNYDISRAEQIAFVQDTLDDIDNKTAIVPIVENWSKDFKDVPLNEVDRERLEIDDDTINKAAIEYEKLYDTKISGSAFAPFVVFRDVGNSNDFWNQKDADVVSYIQSINMSLTELKYLEKFASFGLKYTVNIKKPENGVIAPNGIMQFAIANSTVPGMDNSKNYEVGEFANSGKIDEVIRSIIFNMKMLFSLYNIPLDALISSNSVRSAENKQMDNDELFAKINSQREIWGKNEETLFGVLAAVHNRDNINKIPKGVKLIVDYTENKSEDKTVDDWLIEIQNNVSTVLDWLGQVHPDLDKDELIELLQSNEEINAKNKKEPIKINMFDQQEEEAAEEEQEEEDNN